ncbi:hypothetical protein PF005_g8128 [Phytophthora fragariae]|uniref:Uncharacterized protein n=2 Tax=Phytophthora TaxID=4783 RepID=A0A6A3K2T3_9STRA|nr:hypothetical protein PF003_g7697 [Phytophthora fragariae]KAE8941755.1 hypothetical protein PF009_g8465 [Phytophthora fragariae]KAE8999828.1 hypothetical protein PF011_g14458 [Phytophthora fragariae]KAE9101763.1 hypothetical protein PF010_g14341 [Phytophthora fragariae]KAE9151225.1 hypothetical protein PF006_g4467 [Phytophthora fragariae]
MKKLHLHPCNLATTDVYEDNTLGTQLCPKSPMYGPVSAVRGWTMAYTARQANEICNVDTQAKLLGVLYAPY